MSLFCGFQTICSCLARPALSLALFHVFSAPVYGQAGFRIAGSRLVGRDAVEIRVRVPDTQATFTLEFTPQLEKTPWLRVHDALVAVGANPGELRFLTRAAATAQGYYRVAQWPGAGAPVILNEIMSNNTATLADEDGDFVDWVELYNPTGNAVSLDGFGLSDDPAEPLKWTFSGTIIPANGYLIVFLSGKDRTGGAPGSPHTSFRVSNGREPVVFSNPAGIVLDRIHPGPLASDDALARNAVDPLYWHVFDGTPAATPGAANIPNSGSLPAPFVEAPRFTTVPGFHDSAVEVTLLPAHPGDLVYYTTDGSAPDPAFALPASGPLPVEATTVLRAIAVTADDNRSEPSTGTYLIGASHTLPVLSICAEPGNFEFRDGYLYGFGERLFSRNGNIIGSFPWTNSNAWQNREIDANIEMFEDDRTTAFNEVLGLKVFGGYGSRGYAQKSFAVFARSRRGTGRIRHQLFPDKDIPSFESFVLRNSGNDNQSSHLCVPRSEIRAFSTPASNGNYFVNGNFTLFRDAMMTSLARDIGLDTQGYRPSVVYINGDYWGIYNIREKLNEHYVESNHGVPENQVDLIEGYGSANAGSASEYSRMRNYISGRNMADPENYQFVQDNYLHLDNFIDYHLSVIYFQNFDIGNIKCWRPRVDGGRFRWMVYDQDYGFNLWKPDVYLPAMKRNFSDYDNMFRFYTNASGSGTGWPNEGGRTILLRKMLDNEDFKARFIRRCADLLNSAFSPQHVTARIDAMAGPIRAEIPRHLARWNWEGVQQRGFGHPYKEEDEPFTMELWESHIQVMRDFAAERPAKLRSDLISHFRLEKATAGLRVAVTPVDAGAVRVNSLVVTGSAESPWSGICFEEFPPPLAPVAAPGWSFDFWSGDVVDGEDGTVASISAAATASVTAHFRPATLDPSHAAVVISEIQYHPADQQPGGEWVEIWNTGDAGVPVGGWKLHDEQNANVFVIADGTVLATGARLVVAADPEAFAIAYPEVGNVTGGFSFRLGNGGDAVRLVDGAGAIVEAVVYNDKAPWPERADGGGFTLTRVTPLADAAAATSWRDSDAPGGSPGS